MHFWATVCKTVHPMLSDRCLCCPVLSVTLVYCGQTVAWIKMKLGMQVCLGHGHTVLDGDPAPPAPKQSPRCLAHIWCGQMAGWIKMLHGREVDLGPSDIMLNGDQASSSPKMAQPPIFSPCLLWPNDWMDQDATWHGGRPQPRRHYVG